MNAIGIGDVFRAYHDGRIEDNDEVALQHGPAELGYVPLTEAMANVRATLATAIRAGVLTPTDETALNLGRSPFVTKIALDQAPVAGVCSETLDRFATWRSTNSIDVMRRTTPDQRRAKSLPVIVTHVESHEVLGFPRCSLPRAFDAKPKFEICSGTTSYSACGS
jgi:hypothetical protein